MRNHDQKVRDMARSVLPSTARRAARLTRRHIHHAERQAVAARLRLGDAAPRETARGRIDDLVSTRRSADKVGPLARWALHLAATEELRDRALHEQIEHFRRLLPATNIGRHALSHIAWALEVHHPRRPIRSYRVLFARPPVIDAEDLALVIRRLLEAGYHRELNRRLKRAFEPTTASLRDLERFARSASPHAAAIALRLATDVHVT